MGIALGLAAALSWGLADYFATLASRRAGTLRVVLGFHLVATAVLAVLVLGTGALADVSLGDVAPFVLLGALGWASYLAFYRALAIGPISIVSPIVSGYAAVTLVLAVLVLGERLSGLEIAAVAVAMTGVVLASSDLRRLASERMEALGVLLALATVVLIGAYVFGVAYYAEDFGWLAPIFLARAFATLFLAATAVAAKQWRFPERSSRLPGVIVLLALVDTGGYVFFNFGSRHAETSIVAAAASPYSVVPILMGVFLLAERPARVQWVGIAFVVSGLVLLALFSG